MLYGVRRDLQEQLVREGYRMRVYVPFGTQWYPYLMRRLAERPANVAFITGNVMREMIGRQTLMSMSHARYRPPDHSKGDESTIGGYAAVHDRPGGVRGERRILLQRRDHDGADGRRRAPWARVLPLRQMGAHRRADARRDISRATTSRAARPRTTRAQRSARLPLDEVKALLDRLIAERRGAAPTRRWWDAMRDEGARRRHVTDPAAVHAGSC